MKNPLNSLHPDLAPQPTGNCLLGWTGTVGDNTRRRREMDVRVPRPMEYLACQGFEQKVWERDAGKRFVEFGRGFGRINIFM